MIAFLFMVALICLPRGGNDCLLSLFPSFLECLPYCLLKKCLVDLGRKSKQVYCGCVSDNTQTLHEL